MLTATGQVALGVRRGAADVADRRGCRTRRRTSCRCRPARGREAEVDAGDADVDGPGVGRRCAHVPRDVDGTNVEGVRPVAEPGVADRRRAGDPRPRVELALRAGAGLGDGEVELRVGTAGVGRGGDDHGRRGRGGVDGQADRARWWRCRRGRWLATARRRCRRRGSWRRRRRRTRTVVPVAVSQVSLAAAKPAAVPVAVGAHAEDAEGDRRQPAADVTCGSAQVAGRRSPAAGRPRPARL